MSNRIGTMYLLIAIAGCAAPPAADYRPPVSYPPVHSPTATRDIYTDPIVYTGPIVVLDGSPESIGKSHGTRLATDIQTLHRDYLLKMVGTGGRRFAAFLAASMFKSELRPEHRAEVDALAAASNIDPTQTMLAQCFLDLSPMTACSTIALPASASPDHVARMGRNLDFLSLNVADKYTTVFVVRPNDGRYAYGSVGWPGMIGVLSGMNEHGLCLANMEVTRDGGLPRAMPYTLLYRTVLERCKTVDEAIALLKSTPIQTKNNLMLMDATGDRAAVELSPDFVHVRRAAVDVAVISTNHQRDQDADTPGRCDRYDYLHDTSRADFGAIDEPAVQGLLSHVGNRTTLQSMVFEPANRVIFLATGQGAAKQEFRRLDLTKYFNVPSLSQSAGAKNFSTR